MQALRDFESGCQFIGIDTPGAEEITTYEGRGRLGKDKQPQVHYQLSGRTYSQQDKAAYAKPKVGMFIFPPMKLTMNCLIWGVTRQLQSSAKGGAWLPVSEKP